MGDRGDVMGEGERKSRAEVSAEQSKGHFVVGVGDGLDRGVSLCPTLFPKTTLFSLRLWQQHPRWTQRHGARKPETRVTPCHTHNVYRKRDHFLQEEKH